MPAQVIVEHSALPDTDFQVCSVLEVSAKEIQQANVGKLNEVCMIAKLEVSGALQRYVKLRLVGHQPSKARVQPNRRDSGGAHGFSLLSLLYSLSK